MSKYGDSVVVIIDASDLKCPEPLMLLRKSIRELGLGESVGMHSTDLGTARDIPMYCQHMGHILVESNTDSSPHYFVVKRGS